MNRQTECLPAPCAAAGIFRQTPCWADGQTAFTRFGAHSQPAIKAVHSTAFFAILGRYPAFPYASRQMPEKQFDGRIRPASISCVFTRSYVKKPVLPSTQEYFLHHSGKYVRDIFQKSRYISASYGTNAIALDEWASRLIWEICSESYNYR